MNQQAQKDLGKTERIAMGAEEQLSELGAAATTELQEAMAEAMRITGQGEKDLIAKVRNQRMASPVKSRSSGVDCIDKLAFSSSAVKSPALRLLLKMCKI